MLGERCSVSMLNLLKHNVYNKTFKDNCTDISEDCPSLGYTDFNIQAQFYNFVVFTRGVPIARHLDIQKSVTVPTDQTCSFFTGPNHKAVKQRKESN